MFIIRKKNDYNVEFLLLFFKAGLEKLADFNLQVATIFNENVLNFIMIFPLGTEYILGQFFETSAMATPTKLQNPTVLGLGDPASTQWSHPGRFCHWCPSFGNIDYPPIKSTKQVKRRAPMTKAARVLLLGTS